MSDSNFKKPDNRNSGNNNANNSNNNNSRRNRNRNRNNNAVPGKERDPRSNRRGRFRDRRRGGDRNRRQNENRTYIQCALCESDIRDISSAIALKETGLPAHFDCIIKQLSEIESISPQEKICYLGKGSFGIVRFQRMGGIVPFVIRKRIQYEEFDDTPGWRKDLNKYTAPHPLYKPAKTENSE